jgi:hypothetical protein
MNFSTRTEQLAGVTERQKSGHENRARLQRALAAAFTRCEKPLLKVPFA